MLVNNFFSYFVLTHQDFVYFDKLSLVTAFYFSDLRLPSTPLHTQTTLDADFPNQIRA